jgi:adenosylhomocysteinase
MVAASHWSMASNVPTDVMIAGKVAVVCRLWRCGQGISTGLTRLVGPGVDYGNRSNLCFASCDGRLPRGHDGRRLPIKADIFVTATGNYKSDHSRSHGQDERSGYRAAILATSIMRSTLPVWKNCRWEKIKPQVDHVIFPNDKRIILLARGPIG